jgi:ABC-type multidrug transport system fused ATPase/permease subunit
MPPTIYRYILDTTVRRQVPICLLTLVVVSLSMAPLELQRRIMNDALGARNPTLLAALGALYFVTLMVQGGLKYVLNLARGRLVEDTTRWLRGAIYGRIGPMLDGQRPGEDASRLESGAVVSMVASEAEDVGGFVGDAISLPLLQGGTVIAVTGYLLWLQPLIASFAVIVYLPQFIVVPRVQHAINRLARLYARQVRRLGDLVVQTAPGGAAAAAAAEPYQRTADLAFDTRVRIYRRKFLLTALGNFLDAVGPLAILMIGGWMVIHRGIDVGTIVVFISGFQKIAGPWDELVNFYRAASNAQTKYGLMRETMLANG